MLSMYLYEKYVVNFLKIVLCKYFCLSPQSLPVFLLQLAVCLRATGILTPIQQAKLLSKGQCQIHAFFSLVPSTSESPLPEAFLICQIKDQTQSHMAPRDPVGNLSQQIDPSLLFFSGH